MTRVILVLILICQLFCPRARAQDARDIGFAQPGLATLGKAMPDVIIVHDPRATVAFAAQADVVADMVARGVMAVTGQDSVSAAWRALVQPEDVVGVKVHSPPGPLSGTRPAVAAAVVRGLLDAGHPPSRIVIWDRRMSDLRGAGFVELAASLGVRVAGAVESGFDPDVHYQNPLLGQLVYGDLEFRRGQGSTNVVAARKSHLSRLLTRELTRLINITPLLNHSHAGVSGVLYSVASSATDNFIRFESRPEVMAVAVPEIYGQTNIADRVALNIVDALVGQYEGWQKSLLHYSGTPNELWFGHDPVALDVLAIRELNRIRAADNVPAVTNGLPLYENARLLELGTDRLDSLEILRIDAHDPRAARAVPR